MKPKYIVYGVLALSFIVGYNAWLIQRDNQLFDPVNQLTQKERFCIQQAKWHPDCNVE
jgi:hypothetical protein